MVQTDPCSVGNPEHMALVKCEISEKNPSAHVEMPGQRDSAPMAQDKSLKTIIVVAVVVFAVIVFLVIYADALANQRSEPPPMVPPCPSGWIGFQGMCYYFSEGKRNWTFSQSFCSSQNGLLLIFNSSLETEFVMRHKGKAPFWIGLRRELNQPWKWTNGENSTELFQ
ncbi:C-type lectin domain family 2 member D-like isoform X2 [Eublepharis macularius]|uniref:C-type lectin domain family 2 member D-like isoform X2 n=1 Tax=Eublepharis macularius TaxID=481883 RepID=A0AA97KXC8_EUBMA|nr:C-type lectin domain family 2 member D-like isoform X2 [Eublepharis macularius]